MDISFIVPAYNEEKYIKRTLLSIYMAMYHLNMYSYEIIVVNDKSTDKTREIVKKMGYPVYDVDHRHLGKVRNSGAKMAKGDILVFVDADTVIKEEVVSEMLVALENYKFFGCAYGNFSDLDKAPRLHRWLMKLYNPICKHILKTGCGYFLWTKRSCFEAAKGFHEDYYLFEDVCLCRELKRIFGHFRFNFGKERVETSGRKVWTHAFLKRIPALMGRYLLRGKKMFKTRKHLSIRYDGIR